MNGVRAFGDVVGWFISRYAFCTNILLLIVSSISVMEKLPKDTWNLQCRHRKFGNPTREEYHDNRRDMYRSRPDCKLGLSRSGTRIRVYSQNRRTPLPTLQFRRPTPWISTGQRVSFP